MCSLTMGYFKFGSSAIQDCPVQKMEPHIFIALLLIAHHKDVMHWIIEPCNSIIPNGVALHQIQIRLSIYG